MKTYDGHSGKVAFLPKLAIFKSPPGPSGGLGLNSQTTPKTASFILRITFGGTTAKV